MNKQELIKSIKLARDTYSNENRFRGGVRTGLGIALGVIAELDEPEKVIIPQFVADHIEFCKSENKRLNVALSESPESKMVSEMGVSWEEANEIYARAWLDGYEIEKEKLYYVLNKQGKTLLLLIGGKVCLSSGYVLRDDNKGLYQLTEKQIKDYDERYWAFVVEVAE